VTKLNSLRSSQEEPRLGTSSYHHQQTLDRMDRTRKPMKRTESKRP